MDHCNFPANRTATVVSYLQIVFQLLVINAFALELVPDPVKQRLRRGVFGLCALLSDILLPQFAPIGTLEGCAPETALCADAWCTASGTGISPRTCPTTG